MNTAKKLSGVVLATAAAGLFMSAGIAAAAEAGAQQGQVNCAGVNACKGHGACKSATNSCKGTNACKGHGVVSMSEDTCKAIGGTYTPEKTEKK